MPEQPRDLALAVLESNELGEYVDQEYGRHRSKVESCIRRLDAAQVVELFAEAVENSWTEIGNANT